MFVHLPLLTLLLFSSSLTESFCNPYPLEFGVTAFLLGPPLIVIFLLKVDIATPKLLLY